MPEFDDQSVSRIARVVKVVERMLPDGPKNQPTPKTRQAPIVHIVRATTDTPDADGLYAGTLKLFDPETLTLSGDEDILIFDVNA